MNTLSLIQSELAALPANLQVEVLDFVKFVKQRRGLPSIASGDTSAASDAGDSPFFQALTEVGFVGCIETDEQLSTHYKQQLDFSAKAGVQP